MSHPLLQDLPITTPSAAPGREQNVRLTLVKVSCLMVTLETCHKGKISKCTWNFSPSLAADSFHSIFELPAVKMNSAALVPCRVPLPNQSLPTTVLSCTTSELEPGAGVLLGLGTWCCFPEDGAAQNSSGFYLHCLSPIKARLFILTWACCPDSCANKE